VEQAEANWLAALKLANNQQCAALHRSVRQWQAVAMLRLGMLLEQNSARLKDAAVSFAASLKIASTAFDSDLHASVHAQVRSVVQR
jgi:hypothetical protein